MKFAITIWMVLFSSLAIAQNTCTETLFEANRLYEKGLLSEAIEMAKGCASSTLISDQWKAQRLMTMCYLAQNKMQEARKSAEKMMEINPTYQPSASNDPTELANLLRSIEIMPKLSIGIVTLGGVNWTIPQILKSFNGGPYQKEYLAKSGLQFGLVTGYNLNRNLSIHTGLLAIQKNYELTYALDNIYDVFVSERMTYLELPLFLRFRTPLTKRFHGFVDLGGYAGTSISSATDLELTRTSESGVQRFIAEKLDAGTRKNNAEFGTILGLGTSYKVNTSTTIAANFTYLLGMGYNVTNAEERYANDYLFYDFFYLDDDLRFNSLAFSLSFIWNLKYDIIKK